MALSWLWGPQSAEDAQRVVLGMHAALDEKDGQLKKLSAALEGERGHRRRLLAEGLDAARARRAALAAELAVVDEQVARYAEQLAALDELPPLATWEPRPLAALLPIGATVPSPGSPVSLSGVGGPLGPAAVDSGAGGEVAGEGEGEAEAKDPEPEPEPEHPAPADHQDPDQDGHETEDEATQTSLPIGVSEGGAEGEGLVERVRERDAGVLFVIHRSTNSNTVVYARRTLADAPEELDPSYPLDVYWIMYEQEGAPREGLTLLERNTAYGASAAADPPGQAEAFTVTLASLPDRPLRLARAGGSHVATTTIAGREGAVLRRVYVESTSTWGLPKVSFVEIFGEDAETGEALYEKKLP